MLNDITKFEKQLEILNNRLEKAVYECQIAADNFGDICVKRTTTINFNRQLDEYNKKLKAVNEIQLEIEKINKKILSLCEEEPEKQRI